MSASGGWASGNTALFVQAVPGQPGVVGIFLQQDKDTLLLGEFFEEEYAELFVGWMDAGIGDLAAANAELLRRLEQEQPLTFTPPTEESAT